MTDYFAAKLLAQLDSKPANEVADQLLQHAQAVGFEYPSFERAAEQFQGEVKEFLEALQQGDRAEIETEYADVVYAARKLVQWKQADPDRGTRLMLKKYLKRFAYIEGQLANQKLQWADVSHATHTHQLWHDAKREVG